MGHESADGDIPEGVPPEERPKTGEDKSGKVVYVDVREKTPRDFGITWQVIKDNHPTAGCAGCWSRWNGLAFQPHSSKCRERFREIMKDTARVKNAEKRRAAYEARQSAQSGDKRPCQSTPGDSSMGEHHAPNPPTTHGVAPMGGGGG